MSQLVRLEGKHSTQNAHCAVVSPTVCYKSVHACPIIVIFLHTKDRVFRSFCNKIAVEQNAVFLFYCLILTDKIHRFLNVETVSSSPKYV